MTDTLARQLIDKACSRYILLEVALHRVLEVKGLPPEAQRIIREVLRKTE
jgi:hypothetical protein